MMGCCSPYVVQLQDCYKKVYSRTLKRWYIASYPYSLLRVILPYFFNSICQDSEAWLVMDLCSGGSVLDIMQACDVSDALLPTCVCTPILL